MTNPSKLDSLDAISSDDWSKFLTLAEYRVWSVIHPQIKAKRIQKIIQTIIEGLPQNLQAVGKELAFPEHSIFFSEAEQKLIDDFCRKAGQNIRG